MVMFPLTHVKIDDRIGMPYWHCHKGMNINDKSQLRQPDSMNRRQSRYTQGFE